MVACRSHRPPRGTALPVPGLPLSGLLALSTAAFTAVLTELLPAGLLPRMAPALGVSEGRVGFLVTGYALASFLAAVPLTAALRGLPRRRVLTGTLLGFAFCNAVTAASSWYALTFAARLGAGVMGGTLWAMLVGYAARMVPAERRGRAIAIVLGASPSPCRWACPRAPHWRTPSAGARPSACCPYSPRRSRSGCGGGCRACPASLRGRGCPCAGSPRCPAS